MASSMSVRWVDEHVCQVGDATFLTLGPARHGDDGYAVVFGLGARASTAERFVLLKTRPLIDHYEELLRGLRPERIVQLGIFQGGSVALLDGLATPTTLVAMELSGDRVEPLDAHLATHQRSGAVRLHYGVDQADVDRVSEIVTGELGDSPLDLVLDDASHQLEPTRASFDLLFPRLRPDGTYVIEDWGTGAFSSGVPAVEDHLVAQGPPLAFLAFELSLACATRPDVVALVETRAETLVVRRGDADLDAGTFRLRDCFDPRWQQVLTGDFRTLSP